MRTGVGNDSFGDVFKGEWYYDAVSIAYEYDIISGYGNGKFGSDDKITREQALTIIARAMKLAGLDEDIANADISATLGGYTDSTDIAKYAKSSIETCIKTGIVSGRGEEKLAPKDNITRAEVATIVQKMLKKAELI